MKQVEEAQKAEAEAGTEGSGPTPVDLLLGDRPEDAGTLASDEALAALREKLTGN